MGRYTGPKNRIARRFGVNIFGRARNPLLHKPNAPGMHGARRKKKSDYGLQLDEKQKLKAVYGMLRESQLVTYYRKAAAKKENTADVLVYMLESRLDILVYRLRLAPTIFAAHQLISHGHVLVDGKKVDKRSFQVKQSSVISIREKSRKIPAVNQALAQTAREIPTYLTLDESNFAGTVVGVPDTQSTSYPLEIDIPKICDFLAHTT
jgi:small subunit ribosomal protein S4